MRIAALDIGAAAVEEERVGCGRAACADIHHIIIVLHVGVEIFEPDRDVVRDHHLGAAAGGIAPGVGLAIVGKAVGRVGRRKAVVEPRIGRTASDIEECAAAGRVTGAQAGAGLPIGFAAHRIARGGGRKAGDAIAGDAVTTLDQCADDEIAHTLVEADTAEEFGAVLVVAAADVRGACRGAIAETGRESVGAGRGRDLIAVGAVAIGIEDERFTAIAALQRRAAADRDIGAVEILRPVARGGSAVLSHGRDSQHRRRRSDEERGEFHIFSPLFE